MEEKIAVAYVRVSTKSKAQAHSYEFQEEYWRNKLSNTPGTKFAGIYADKAISGSTATKRPQFQAMMQDAREGRFNVIYTKSVSRFSRNTVDLLTAVRELRDLGVEVFFETENIRSTQPASEIYLTLAATIAENDLITDSKRLKWSIQHRYENGWIGIGSGMYGYKLCPENTLEIIPEEAEIVRRIFTRYIEGAGIERIAKELNESKVPSFTGNKWAARTIWAMLQNEKYMGDSLMGKSVWNFGVKQDNRDGRYGAKYYTENTHEGIVSRETFMKAQELLQTRSNPKVKGKKRPTYSFTGLVQCGCCGAPFRHKINHPGKNYETEIWLCTDSLKLGASYCNNQAIKESVLREKFISAYNEFVTQRPEGKSIAKMQSMILGLQDEERELASLALQHLIPAYHYQAEQKRIKEKIKDLTDEIAKQRGRSVLPSDFCTITEFDQEKVEKFLKKVTVTNYTVTFKFYNDVSIRRHFTNGKPGNAPGWNRRNQ